MKNSEMTSVKERPFDPATADDVALARRLDYLVKHNRSGEADETMRQVARARGNTGAAVLLLDRLGGNG